VNVEALGEAIGKKGLAWVACSGFAYIGGGLSRHKGLLALAVIVGGVGAARGGVHWPQWAQLPQWSAYGGLDPSLLRRRGDAETSPLLKKVDAPAPPVRTPHFDFGAPDEPKKKSQFHLDPTKRPDYGGDDKPTPRQLDGGRTFHAEPDDQPSTALYPDPGLPRPKYH